MSNTKHAAEPWSDKKWSTTGPSAATAYVISKSFQERGHSYCTVAQADADPGLSICVAVGVNQEEANSNAARIVECVNALAGVDDPAVWIAEARACMAAMLGG